MRMANDELEPMSRQTPAGFLGQEKFNEMVTSIERRLPKGFYTLRAKAGSATFTNRKGTCCSLLRRYGNQVKCEISIFNQKTLIAKSLTIKDKMEKVQAFIEENLLGEKGIPRQNEGAVFHF